MRSFLGTVDRALSEEIFSHYPMPSSLSARSAELVQASSAPTKNGDPISDVAGVGDDGMSLGEQPGRGEQVSREVSFAGDFLGPMNNVGLFRDRKNIQ